MSRANPIRRPLRRLLVFAQTSAHLPPMGSASCSPRFRLPKKDKKYSFQRSLPPSGCDKWCTACAPESFFLYHRFFLKMFYLLNRASKSRTVFIIAFFVSRSLKLDPMLIDFDELKKTDEKTEPGARFSPFQKRHGRASHGSKKYTFFRFREARPCLSRKKKRASRGMKKKVCFPVS